MSQEARFLEARESRSAAQRSTRRESRHNNLHDFWTSLRRDLNAWEIHLNVLVEEESSHMKRTTSQRMECTEKLDVLLTDLYSLRRNCLSSTDVPELPPASVRLLHQEFIRLSTKLERARESLIPTTKFTFKRYHAAIQQQQSLKQKCLTNEAAPKQTESSRELNNILTTTLAGNAIQNHYNATLTMDSSGQLTIQSKNGDEAPIFVRQAQENASSLLVQNLESCHVTV